MLYKWHFIIKYPTHTTEGTLISTYLASEIANVIEKTLCGKYGVLISLIRVEEDFQQKSR